MRQWHKPLLALVVIGLAVLWVTSVDLPAPARTLFMRQGGAAPGRTAPSGPWTSGAKEGVGTAYTYDAPGPQSRVWFTLANGAVTDVLYPTVEQGNVRELTYLVSDGRSFVHREADLERQVAYIDRRALAYRITLTDPAGRYRLVKEVLTDPAADVLLVDTSFQVLQRVPGDYQLYAYLTPRLQNGGRDDVGGIDLEQMVVYAADDDVHLALAANVPWLRASVGYSPFGIPCRVPDASDGLADLLCPGDYAGGQQYLMDWQYDTIARPGRLGFTIQLPADRRHTLALGLGGSRQVAVEAVHASLRRGFGVIKADYLAGWQRYVASLEQLSGVPDLYYQSAMMMKAHEDKTYRGALVASLAVPWGERAADTENGYRKVWGRDLYHATLALFLAGDRSTMADVLRYLDERQQRADGSFPQNSYLDGRQQWSSTQMDEIADAILLAWWAGASERYASLVRPAAEYLLAHGPQTPQERWEENGGYSPATLAAEIAGLVAAAELATQAGDPEAAERYLAAADEWAANIEAWTFTTTGPSGQGRYYLRITASGQPDAAQNMTIANGGGTHDQRQIVDQSFLELVRLGVRSPRDPHVVQTLPVIDAQLRIETPGGPSFYRYNFDGYGNDQRQSKGRLWTLLTAERGMYELAAGNPTGARQMLQALDYFANAGGLLPEQVFEDTGRGTGSATPLAWSHGEYLILTHSLLAGRPLDQPAPVYQRYAAR
ncbi:MAG: glucan 1,4-alpha-glucosidase [Deinococcus sp.]|nr:glucan 1,4-alpha-glucosidase [Deinococcus sp.]